MFLRFSWPSMSTASWTVVRPRALSEAVGAVGIGRHAGALGGPGVMARGGGNGAGVESA